MVLISGIGHYGFKTKRLKPNTNLEIMCYVFQELSNHMPLNFKDDGLNHIGFNIVYLTIPYY
jgi:hypothetical protein